MAPEPNNRQLAKRQAREPGTPGHARRDSGGDRERRRRNVYPKPRIGERCAKKQNEPAKRAADEAGCGPTKRLPWRFRDVSWFWRNEVHRRRSNVGGNRQQEAGEARSRMSGSTECYAQPQRRRRDARRLTCNPVASQPARHKGRWRWRLALRSPKSTNQAPACVAVQARDENKPLQAR